MFPLLPILILLLMGPANAERLANEGRLPAALLAIVRPVQVTVVAPVEEPLSGTAVVPTAGSPRQIVSVRPLPRPLASEIVAPGWPTRAGPQV